MLIIFVKNLNLVSVFVILSQFSYNSFLKWSE